jgi:hypothetical protein
VGSPPSARSPDGPPPYRVHGQDRFLAWLVADHPDWVEWEVWLWISGLCWDPWQEPSVQSTASGSTGAEVRNAVVPDTSVGVSYSIWPKSHALWLIAVADLP